MQSILEHTPHTAQQRGIDATRRLREVLGLNDLKLLATALAEVASDEAARNPIFADQIRASYHQLEALKPRGRKPPAHTIKPNISLTPITTIDPAEFDAHGQLDPYFLLRLYGGAQLRDALDGYSLAKLKEAAAIVEGKHPGTKPKNKSRKDSIIDYIVEYVAGSGN